MSGTWAQERLLRLAPKYLYHVMEHQSMGFGKSRKKKDETVKEWVAWPEVAYVAMSQPASNTPGHHKEDGELRLVFLGQNSQRYRQSSYFILSYPAFCFAFF